MILIRPLLLGVLLASAASAVAEEIPLSLPPAADWTVETNDGRVTVANPEPGMVTFDYDLKVQKAFTIGYTKFEQATARVLLREPLPLGKDSSRLLFECRGMEKVLNRYGKLQLMPLIRDRTGEVFTCESYAYPHVNAGTKGWGLWTTAHLYGGEAGGATQNVYQTDGTGDGWPDAPLQLLGFELQVRGELGENLHGQFALGDLSAAGMILPARPPYLYADSMLDQDAGTFTFAAEASTVFQGRPAYFTTAAFAFDPASLLSRKRKLFLPTGPEGYFWGTYLLRDPAQRVIRQEKLTYSVDPGVVTPSTQANAPAAAPGTRPLRLSTSGPVPGVIPAGQPFGVSVETEAALLSGKLELAWKLHPIAFPNVLAEGRMPLMTAGKTVFLALPDSPDRDAYRLEATLLSDGRPADTLMYFLGRPTDLSRAYAGRAGRARLRDEVKADAYFRTTFRLSDGSPSEDAAFEEFQTYLREAGKMARDVSLTIDAARGEILPGVFDFTLLDRLMDAAADVGAGVTVRELHQDSLGFYTWPRLEKQRNYDGSEIYQHHYGDYSPHDPVLVTLWQDLFHAVHDRYRTHPAFQGYYLMQPSGETVVLDQPWLGIIAGYSEYARAGFRRYLQEQLKLDLAALNLRWSTQYHSWDEIAPPLPDFSTRTLPDLRPQWIDFQRFKLYVDNQEWFANLARDIRSYDPDHVIIAYGGRTAEGLQQWIDYTHGGGVPEIPANGEEEALWLKHKVGAIQESIHPFHWAESGDPGDKGWLLDWDLYTMFSRAGGGGMNLHIYYYPVEPMTAKYGGVYAFDRYQKFKPVMRELHDTVLTTPLSKEVAVLQDPLTEMTKHRTIFVRRLEDLSRWFTVLQQTGASYETFRAEQTDHYRLVLPNLIDEVMSRENIDRLANYARQGGHLIIAANTGRYCDQPGARPYAFLDALGIPAPSTGYLLSGQEVSAQAVPDLNNPLMAGIATIPFYTREQQHRQTRSNWERADYLQWPYRWLPETDYFGYYPGQHPGGQALARFADGGTAISLHKVGQGEVIVFWGSPDYRSPELLRLLRQSMTWAGVTDKSSANPIPLMMEARNAKLRRDYAIIWQGQPGKYRERFPLAPDGKLLLEDLISDRRLGIVEGAALRDPGLELDFESGASPLKVIRMSKDIPDWATRTLASPSPQPGKPSGD